MSRTGAQTPRELTLEFRPTSRVDVIDVTARVEERVGEEFRRHRKALYCSHHTTAGFLEQSLCARLGNEREGVDGYIRAFRELFPPDADYRHDQLHLRRELTDEQRDVEPLNADSHLTFMGSGLNNCVTYANRGDSPVFFIDLDGVYRDRPRVRRTTVIGYDSETPVTTFALDVPVSRHTVDSINLRDPRLGVMEAIDRELRASGIPCGRVRISLDAGEHQAALTVNEYETLLMRHDLAEVLSNPLRFVAEKGRHMLRDPRAIPNKTLNYVKYDMVHVFNELLDVLGIHESRLEKLLSELLARPASRFLRMKHSVSLLVSRGADDGEPRVVHGRYQSPILVQWQRAPRQARRLLVAIEQFG
jgi:thiamine phosphate synthase YjbQ (UPF0047 family)